MAKEAQKTVESKIFQQMNIHVYMNFHAFCEIPCIILYLL